MAELNLRSKQPSIEKPLDAGNLACTMRRDEALAIIAAHKDELKRHHVRTLSIFGSVARDDARPDSDVDCLVEFDAPVGLFAFVGLKLYLEEILGTRVDLATPDALRASMRDRILSEAIRAA